MLRHPHDHWEIFDDDEIPGDDDPSIELVRGQRGFDGADIHINGPHGEIAVTWHMQEQFFDALLKLRERCKIQKDKERIATARRNQRLERERELFVQHGI